MRSTTLVAICALVGLSVAAISWGQQPQGDEPAQLPEAAAEPSAVPGGTVQMAEFTVGRASVRGRILEETQEALRIEALDGSSIRYIKGALTDLKRYTMSARAYYEARGDYHRERAWAVEDASAEFIKARQAYEKALEAAASDKERADLMQKLSLVERDREEWHKEALRKQEIRKAQEEVELLKLQKDLAREELTAVRRHDQDIQKLQADLRDVQDQLRRAVSLLDRMDLRLRQLEDDVSYLKRRDSVFITSTVFLDFRRSFDDLRRRVEALERAARTP